MFYYVQSSLIQSILGELPLSHGSIQLHGDLSYAPQEAWVFAGRCLSDADVGDTRLLSEDGILIGHKSELSIFCLCPSTRKSSVGEQREKNMRANS